MSVLFASLAAVFFGTADFTGGFASRKNSIPAVLVWSQLAGLALVILFIVVDGRAAVPSLGDGLFGAAAGIAGLGGLAFLYRGLSRGLVAIVSPLAALIGAVTPLVGGLLLGERMSTLAAFGVALALPAIVLVSWQGRLPLHEHDQRRMRESLRDGVASGFFFGLFFLLISIPDDASGMWPLAVARICSISFTVLVVSVPFVPSQLWGGRSDTPRLQLHGGVFPVIAAGVMDMAANIFLVLAFRSGLLSIAAVISSAYPVQTVVLSRFIFGERVGTVRIAGIVLALSGIALMSA